MTSLILLDKLLRFASSCFYRIHLLLRKFLKGTYVRYLISLFVTLTVIIYY